MASSGKLNFEIATQWDGTPITCSPVGLFLLKSSDGAAIKMEVVAPFHDDPAPPGPSGSAQPGLWDYEVVEAFFLGADDTYLEVELCPYGQHLVLLLHGVRNVIQEGLPLEFEATIQRNEKTWKGEALVPLDYLPGGLKGFNAYAIHGVGDSREYQSLFPAERGKHNHPDFHRLEYFQDIDWSSLVDVSSLPTPSSVWK